MQVKKPRRPPRAERPVRSSRLAPAGSKCPHRSPWCILWSTYSPCPSLTGAPLQGGGWAGSPEGPSPTPQPHTWQDGLEVPAAPQPSSPRGKPGQNAPIARHDQALNSATHYRKPWLQQGRDSSSAPGQTRHRHPPRPAPGAAEPLTQTWGPAPMHKPRSSPTALPAMPGRPFPVPRERPARPNPPRETRTRLDPPVPQHRPQPPGALRACATAGTNHRALRDGGREARRYHSGRGSLVYKVPFSA